MKPDLKTLSPTNPEITRAVNLTTAEKAQLVMHAMGMDDLDTRIPGSAFAFATEKSHGLPLAEKSQINQILLEFAEALEKQPSSTVEPGTKQGNQATPPKQDHLAKPVAARDDKSQTPSRKGSTVQLGKNPTRPGAGISAVPRKFRFSEEHPRVCALLLAQETTARAKDHLQTVKKSLAQKIVLNLLEIETQPPVMAGNARNILGRNLTAS